MSRMRFGIFLPPFHMPTGQNPTTALQRDVELIEQLEALDYDEVWVGEHHSCGVELIGDPTLFLAHAAARTSRIKLGTGVLSLPYHNPLWVAERAVLLDHLSRGRFMLGLGPGAIPTDAAMIGLHPTQLRGALEEDTEVVIRLLRSSGPVTKRTNRYNLVDARLQMGPYSDFDIVIAAIASPTGPRIAGIHGLGLISVGATMVGDLDVLGMHWDVAEEMAAASGQQVDRGQWRLVAPMFIAETREQAKKEVAYRIDPWVDYLQRTAATPHFRPPGTSLEERIDWVNESGSGVIGTPDDAIAMIRKLQEQSKGGFGSFLMMAHEWARPDAMRRHYQLFADEVAPHFQDSLERQLVSEAWAQTRHSELDAQQTQALAEARERHERTRPVARVQA